MNTTEIINLINAIENNDKQYLQKVFKLLLKHESVLGKGELELIKDKIVKCITVDFDLFDDLAKVSYLEKEAKDFPSKCNYVLQDIDQHFHTKYTKVIERNVVSNLRYMITDINKNSETSERPRIKINQEVTLLLAFMKAMRDEFTNKETITDYRLSQLVSDNFSNKEGKPIELNYCKNKFSTGNGIPIHDNQKLKTVLENVLRKI